MSLTESLPASFIRDLNGNRVRVFGYDGPHEFDLVRDLRTIPFSDFHLSDSADEFHLPPPYPSLIPYCCSAAAWANSRRIRTSGLLLYDPQSPWHQDSQLKQYPLSIFR